MFQENSSRFSRNLFLCSLGPLSAVLGTGLFPVRNSCGIEGTTDNMISGTGQVLYPAAANQNHAVLLQVVSFTGNIARNLDAVGKTYPGHLTQSRVGLLGGEGLYNSTHTTLLGSRCIRSLLVKRVVSLLQSRCSGLLYGSLASLSY